MFISQERISAGLKLKLKGEIKMRTVSKWLGGAALLAMSSVASAVTYDFDTVAAGSYDEVTFSSMFDYVSFDNTGGSSFSVASCTLGPDFTCGNAILNSPYSNEGNSTIATFDYLVDSVSVTIGDYAADADTLYLYAYDSINNLIASDTFDLASSTSGGPTLSVSAANIAYVEYYGVGINNNSVYWDNFTFSDMSATVPAPASILLLGVGLLALGFRKNAQV